MAQFGLNVSSNQIDKLKKAIGTIDTSKLEAANFQGNAESIFAEFNVSNDNIFKDTGLDKILNNIAGDDGQISEEELKKIMESDGDELFSMNDFVAYAENAINEALKEIEIDSSSNKTETKASDSVVGDDEPANMNSISTKNYDKGDIKTRTVEKDADGNIISRTDVKADGSTVVCKYENGLKVSQETSYADGTKTSTALKYDENGKKIGASTSRYDENGNFQNLTVADYDAETGRKTHAKTTLPDGSVQGEADYEYTENTDGSYSEKRYAIGSDGSRTLTTTTEYDKEKNPERAIHHNNSTTEIFNRDKEGKVVSSTIQNGDGTTRAEDTIDANGNVLKHVEYTSDGRIASETTYEYYDNGNEKSKNTKTYIQETATVEESKAASAAKDTTTTLSSVAYNAAPAVDNTQYAGTGELSSDVKNALDQKLGSGFANKLEEISQRLNCNPEDLVGLMYSESGLSASIQNSNGGATGLIQFMPNTAKAMGTTTNELKNMTPVQQLDYVEKCINMSKGVAGMSSNEKVDAGTLYGLVFLPAVADNDVLCDNSSKYSWAYRGNSGLDLDGNGNISKQDLSNRVRNKYKEFCSANGVVA